MDVGIAELRANLREWLAAASGGEEVVVTDRGVPIARLLPAAGSSTIDRLTAEGVIARPDRARRPKARGRELPVARRPISDVVTEQRR